MILNFGSINADFFYSLPHLPQPGETLAATAFDSGLGGKGANQSVAVAQAGMPVRHVGAVGPDGEWAVARMKQLGVDTRHISRVEEPTAHALVMVDARGENQIVIYPGANHCQSLAALEAALHDTPDATWLMLQNETNLVPEAAQLAHDRGLKVGYSAAPFDPAAVEAVLPFVTLLSMNAVEQAQLLQALGMEEAALPCPQVLVTKGSEGAVWRSGAEIVSVPAYPVTPVDTTGAGDTFTGYAVAGFAEGLAPEVALRRASAAAALSVMKKGTADAIPSRAEVDAFLG